MPSSVLRERIYARYNSISRGGDSAPADEWLHTRAPYLRRLVRQHFPADRAAAIIDLGCGYGALLHFAREAGYGNVSGIDGSPDQVRAARALGIEGVREGDALRDIVREGSASYDAVIAFDLIEHLRDDELLRLVDEVRRVLKPGGRWLIHTPNAESPFFGRVRYGDLTHEQAFTRTSLSQLLLASGFRSVEFFEDAPVVHGLTSAVRYVLWRGIRAGLRLYIGAETGNMDRQAVFTQNFLARAMI